MLYQDHAALAKGEIYDRFVQLAATATHEGILAVGQGKWPVARFHVANVIPIPSWNDRPHEGRSARAFYRIRYINWVTCNYRYNFVFLGVIAFAGRYPLSLVI